MIYIDLCDEQWRAVEITAAGWRIVSDPPVHFRRPKGARPLPEPVAGGSVDSLRRLINVGNDRNWVLCSSWLIATFRPRGPYPILILQGEQGSAKSTMGKMLRRIIDPFAALVRTAPRDERDLLIAANNSWVIAFDNLSGIQHWLSDSLCRLATGGGFSTRQLYTDEEEIFFDAMRPIILNGIDHLAERADLADRSVILHLPAISESQRRDEAQLCEDFERVLPEIFGALLTSASEAMRRVGDTRLERRPRMADFALWAVAAECSLGFTEGTFLEAYDGNRAEAIQDVLESDSVATAIASFVDEMEDRYWEGSCKELQVRLDLFVDERTKKSNAWPQTPRALSGRLRRLTAALRESGIEIAFSPRTSRKRTVSIARKGEGIDRH